MTHEPDAIHTIAQSRLHSWACRVRNAIVREDVKDALAQMRIMIDAFDDLYVQEVCCDSNTMHTQVTSYNDKAIEILQQVTDWFEERFDHKFHVTFSTYVFSESTKIQDASPSGGKGDEPCDHPWHKNIGNVDVIECPKCGQMEP